jgi:hypothetical protein
MYWNQHATERQRLADERTTECHNSEVLNSPELLSLDRMFPNLSKNRGKKEAIYYF